MSDCPICGEWIPAYRLEMHVNSCMDKHALSLGEPTNNHQLIKGPKITIKAKEFKAMRKSTCNVCGWITYTFQEHNVHDSRHCSHCDAQEIGGNDQKDVQLIPGFVSTVLEVPVAQSAPQALCIQLTKGSFLKDYVLGYSLLHIGISDSKGRVYNFDEKGRRVDRVWKESINIFLMLNEVHAENWDRLLEEFFQEELLMAKYAPYHAMQNNCYNFVMRFLNSIHYLGISDHTKESIVEQFLNKPVGEFENFLQIQAELEKKSLGGKIEPELVVKPS